MGKPERAAAARRHRELSEGTAQAAARGQEPRHRQSSRRKDERVSRLTAAVRRP